MLNILKSLEDGKLLIHLEGRLDTVTAPELEQEIRASLDDAHEIELDLEKLDYISSAGLRVLLSTEKAMSAKEGNLVLKNVQESVMEIFEVTGFSDILTIA